MDLGPLDPGWLAGSPEAGDELQGSAALGALLETLVGGPTERRRQIAGRLVDQGDAGVLSRLSVVDLLGLGLRPAELRRLLAAFALGRRAVFPRERPPTVRAPADVLPWVVPLFLGAEQERFVVLVLDVRHRLRRLALVGQGGADLCPVDPREVFVHAIRERGSAVVVAHNHPSGDPTPSEQDAVLTRRLAAAGEIVGVGLVDHIVVGGPGLDAHPDARPDAGAGGPGGLDFRYYSFAESAPGLLGPLEPAKGR